MSNRANISLYRPNKKQGQFIERRKADRRTIMNNHSFPASLMTQIIVDHQLLIDEPSFSRQPQNGSINSYQKTANIRINRMPAGFGQDQIV